MGSQKYLVVKSFWNQLPLYVPFFVFEKVDVKKFLHKCPDSQIVLEPTLYIKISKGYIPKDRIEKNYYLSTKKRNLLLSNK